MIPEACKTEQQLIDLFNTNTEWVGWVVKQTATNPKNPNIKLYRRVLKRMFDDLKLEEA